MRRTILKIDHVALMVAMRTFSTREVGKAMLAALTVAESGPLTVSDIRNRIGLGRAKWLDEFSEERLFFRRDGKLHLREELFAVRRVGSDRTRVNLSRALRELIHERDGYLCSYCGTGEGPFEVDHIHPLSRGGSDDEDNLCLACKPCNRAKSNMTIEEWGVRQ